MTPKNIPVSLKDRDCVLHLVSVMIISEDALQYHDSCKFITPRFDNDKSNYYNLAMTLKAPWWYCSDLAVRLTGDAGNAHIGILWGGPSGIMEYNKYVVMMIRPNL